MINATVAEMVTQFPLFKGLTPTEIDTVLAESFVRHITAGSCFFHQGELADISYVLTAGRVKLSSLSPEGQQVIMDILQPGNGLGVIVVLGGMKYPVSAEALQDSTALAWQYDTMTNLIRQYPQIALNGLKMLGHRFTLLQDRFHDVSTRRVEQRVARALVRLVHQLGKPIIEGILLDLPLSREELAQMTGTNSFNTSRILSKWEHADIIQTSRKRIIICDVPALTAIAEDLRATLPHQK